MLTIRKSAPGRREIEGVFIVAVCEGCGHENEPTADFCVNRACRQYLGWSRKKGAGLLAPLATSPEPVPTANTHQPVVADAIPLLREPVTPPLYETPEQYLQVERQRLSAIPVMAPPDPPAPGRPTGLVSTDGNQGLMLAIDAQRLNADPGGWGSFTAHLKNQGTVVDAMTVDVIGLPKEWVTVEPRTVNLFVGAESTVQIRISPPLAATTTPGLHAVEVAAWSGTNPNVRCVQSLTVSVSEFRDIDAQAEPAIAVGRFEGKFSLKIFNGGNADAHAHVQGAHDEGTVGIVCRPSTLVIKPGGTAKVAVSAKPPFLFTGAPNVFNINLTVHTSEFSRTFPVHLKQPPLLSKWVARIVLAVVAIVVIVVGVKFLTSHKPHVPSIPHHQGAIAQPHVRFAGSSIAPAFRVHTILGEV